MRRTFSLENNISSEGGLIDIPHIAFFGFDSIKSIIETFETTWGAKPVGIVIPVASPDGLNVEVKSSGLPLSTYSSPAKDLKDFSDVIGRCSNEGLDIYLLLDPTLHFCRTDSLHIIDVVGDSSSSICIGNPKSQELLGAILGTAIDEARLAAKGNGKLKGVVLDVVNIWPMGADNERIELNCFCHSCEKYFVIKQQEGLLAKFRDFPNPSNLLLKDSGSGISHIHDFTSKIKIDEIIGLSRQKGLDRVFKDADIPTMRERSTTLMQYLVTRHNQTVDSVKRIFDEALNGLEDDIRRIILTEGLSYDWTSGIFLNELDHSGNDVCDEVWYDPRQSDLTLANKAFRSYMWRRSRYYVDAFLGFAGNASDPIARATTGIARLSEADVKDKLKSRLNQAIGAGLNEQSALASLPSFKSRGTGRVGFVGLGITREYGERLIDALRIPKGLNDDSDDRRSELMELLQGMLKNGSGA